MLPISGSSVIIKSMSTLAWMKSPSVLRLTVPLIPMRQCSCKAPRHPAQSVHQAIFITLYIAEVPNAKTLLLSLTLWDTVPWAIQ